jgi:hypothetical protein
MSTYGGTFGIVLRSFGRIFYMDEGNTRCLMTGAGFWRLWELEHFRRSLLWSQDSIYTFTAGNP